MVRIVYLAVYAALAALGESLVARPALLWLRSLGVLRAVVPWDVPLGALAFLLALSLAALTLWLAAQAALGVRPRVPQHAVFLGALGACFALRAYGIVPRPPADPAPKMYECLRAAADALDQKYAARYDASGIEPGPSPFVRFGRLQPCRVQVVAGADGPVREARAAPGTIVIALSPDRTSAWLTAISTSGTLRGAVESHAGTHSLPGRDRDVPAYPGMRSVTEKR